MLRGGEAKRDKRKESGGEGEVHLALHHTWEGGWVAWANDVVLKLAKHCERRTLSLYALRLVSPHHRTLQQQPSPSSSGMKLSFKHNDLNGKQATYVLRRQLGY